MSAAAISTGASRPESRPSPNTARPGRSFRQILVVVAKALVAFFILFTCFTFLRPSPYDFAAVPAMLLWLVLGLKVHRGALLPIGLVFLFQLGLATALLPYLNEADPPLWTFQSFYLSMTGVFFILFFSDDTGARFDLAAGAYLASTLFAAVCGIISYFEPNGILFVMDGRAAGVFEDPNLLGSFLMFGGLYLTRRLLVGGSRYPLLATLALVVIMVALFLSFSRGAWGAFVFAAALTVGFTYRSSGRAVRRRIAVSCVIGVTLVAVALSSLAAIPEVADTFADRFTLTKDYDEGVTGRFGNQMRSIPILMENPTGLGPLRFRLRFGLDPHNSYIGGFSNGGWLGGFAFLGLAMTTLFAAFRLCVLDSPFRARAQVAGPAVATIFFQAFQIDVDHWRHSFILLGMVWGLECGRQAWAARARMALPRTIDPRHAWSREPVMTPSSTRELAFNK